MALRPRPLPTLGKRGGEGSLVSGNPHRAADRVRILSYREESYRSASRSGHCAALLPTPGPRPGHQLLLFGGCDSAEPEVAGHWRHGEIRVLLRPCLGWEAVTMALKPL